MKAIRPPMPPMKSASPSDEAALAEDVEKRAALRRMRRIAAGVLAVVALVFLATHFPEQPGTLILLIRAMAEAGMIGGIADWYAVEALFRRPLGLPIPHTALLPNNQQKAARNVGRFFNNYFLDPEQIKARVEVLQPARRAAAWLRERENARLVAGHLTEALSAILDQPASPRLVVRLRRELRKAVGAEETTRALSHAILPALREGLRGPFITDVVGQVSKTIDKNREQVTEIVKERSRWWIASGVDRRVSGVLVDGVLALLEDLSAPDSQRRADFEQALARMIDRLAEGDALTQAIGRGKEGFLTSESFETLLRDLTAMAQDKVRAGVAEQPEKITELITDALQRFAGQLADDPETLAAFEARLADAARAALIDLRTPIGSYVAEVIASWDPETLSDRFEVEIGPDLQFIRINGVVLGALIGGLLFGVGALLGH